MKLQKTSDYVLEQSGESKIVNHVMNPNGLKFFNIWAIILKHAIFIKQDLEKQMIVPCDAAGNILEEPKDYNFFKSFTVAKLDYKPSDELFDQWHKYAQAKEKVLFSNVEKTIVPGVKDIIYCIGGIPVLVCYDNKNYKIPFGLNIIEDLIPYDVELTETAQKQLGYE